MRNRKGIWGKRDGTGDTVEEFIEGYHPINTVEKRTTALKLPEHYSNRSRTIKRQIYLKY